MRSSFAAAAVAAAVAMIAAACGGSSATQLGGGASVLPVDTQAYFALDTSVSAGARDAADELLAEFPGQAPLVARIRTRFDALQPALGRELDLVLTAAGGTVALTKPKDGPRVLQLLGTGVRSKQLGGWTAYGDDVALAALTPAASLAPLAKDPDYLAAMKTVSPDAIGRAYAAKTQAAVFLGALPGQTQLTTGVPGRRARPPTAQQTHAVIAEQVPAWAAASVVEANGGAVVQAHVHYLPPPQSLLERASLSRIPTLPYGPHLLDEIPAGAVFVADLPVSQSEFEVDTGKLATPLQDLLGRYPQLGSGLDYVLAGETALYLRPAVPLPEVTIVSQPLDTLTAEQALNQTLTTLHADGGIFAGLRLYHAILGGEFVISTTQSGIDAFRGAGGKLSADSTFAAARKAAGLSSTTTGLVYADLRQAQPLVQQLAALLGVDVPAGGGAVSTLLAFATRGDADASYTVSLRLR